jgi:hypothetical protein
MNNGIVDKMSIQVGLYGLSFYLNAGGKEVFLQIPYETELPSGLNDILDNIHSETLKTYSVTKPVVLHHNNLNTIVPGAMLDTNRLKDLLKFNTKILESDTLEADTNLPSETANVYIPYENVNNFFVEHYGEIDYYHSATAFLKYAFELHKHSETDIFVRPGNKDFQMSIFRRGELLFFNSFPMENTDDFLYYFFFVWEEKELTPLRPGIHILGYENNHRDLEKSLKHFSPGITYHSQAEPDILKSVL